MSWIPYCFACLRYICRQRYGLSEVWLLWACVAWGLQLAARASTYCVASLPPSEAGNCAPTPSPAVDATSESQSKTCSLIWVRVDARNLAGTRLMFQHVVTHNLISLVTRKGLTKANVRRPELVSALQAC
jgi:hypothetical protein